MDGSAEAKVSIRAVCKEGSTSLQTAVSDRRRCFGASLGDANPPPHPPGPPSRGRTVYQAPLMGRAL